VGKSSRKLVLCLESPSEFGGDLKAVRRAKFLACAHGGTGSNSRVRVIAPEGQRDLLSQEQQCSVIPKDYR
jgi:hypothetical protein